MDSFVSSLEQLRGLFLRDFGLFWWGTAWLAPGERRGLRPSGAGPDDRITVSIDNAAWSGSGQCNGVGCSNQVRGPAIPDHAGLCSFDSSARAVGWASDCFHFPATNRFAKMKRRRVQDHPRSGIATNSWHHRWLYSCASQARRMQLRLGIILLQDSCEDPIREVERQVSPSIPHASKENWPSNRPILHNLGRLRNLWLGADTTCSSHLNATSVVCDWFRSCFGHLLSAELLRKWQNGSMLILPRYDKPHLTRKTHYLEVSCRMDQNVGMQSIKSTMLDLVHYNMLQLKQDFGSCFGCR